MRQFRRYGWRPISMKPMTQVSVFFSFPHVVGNPGIGNIAYNQVVGLIEEGCHVHLSCTTLGRKIDGLVSLQETLRIRGHRVPHRIMAGTRNAYRYHDFRAARRLARLSKTDVVHVWPAACLNTLQVARALRVPGLREAPSEHTAQAFAAARAAATSVGVDLPKKHSHARSPERLRRELLEFGAAAGILAPSEHVQRSFLERGYPARKIFRHQYGYDPSSFYAARVDDATDEFVALIVGRGEPNKGLHHALRVWRDMDRPPDAQLKICGTVEPSYARVISSLLDQSSVEQLGFVADIGSIMRTADVLLHPSLTEGSALVIYEAMACGVVPLVSDAAGAPVEDGEGVLIHRAGAEQELRSQLERLLTERDQLVDLRQTALDRARTLTWTDAGRRLTEAYREALATFGNP